MVPMKALKKVLPWLRPIKNNKRIVESLKWYTRGNVQEAMLWINLKKGWIESVMNSSLKKGVFFGVGQREW